MKQQQQNESTKKSRNRGIFSKQNNNQENYEYFGNDDLFRLSKRTVSIKDEDAQGKTKYRPISRYVKIASIEQCEETNEVTVVLHYFYKDKYHTEKVTRDQIQVLHEIRKLSNKGIDIYNANEKVVSTYLRIQEESASYLPVFEHLGWEKREDELVYKHFQQIGSNNTKAEYRGKFDIKPKGTLNGYLEVIRKYVLKRKYLEFILSVGYSAPVVGLLSTELEGDSLLFHIYGKSSQGKTTASMVAVSPFGKPTKSADGLIKSWGSTKNAIFVHLRNNFGVPIVLDEASMSQVDDFTSLIYMFAENREKDRMNKNGTLRDQGKWATTIISTAEHSLFSKTNKNEGLRVRAFEVANVALTDSAEHARKISEGIQSNYGHAGIKFVEHLQELGLEAVRKRCNSWAMKCETELPKSAYLPRVSEKFGIILATADLVNEVFDLTLNLDSIMEVMYEMEEASRQERDADDKAYQFIIEQIIQNQKYFIKDEHFAGHECWGKIQMTAPKAEVSILQHKFKELMGKAEINNLDGVLKTWKERGYLKAENGKHTNRRKVNKSRDTVYIVLVDYTTLRDYAVKKTSDSYSDSGASPIGLVQDVTNDVVNDIEEMSE